MSLSDITPLVSAMSGALAIASLIYTWLTARSRVNADEIKALRDRSQEHDRRLDVIERDIEHLPDRNHAHTMQVELAKMSGEIQILSERLKPVAAISERLQEFLIAEASGRRGA
ncbi:DUF2730 family protein [Polymorphum gilvum]|uniref:Hypothetical phage protein n=1 Tax=Polymorphum gilvum (strain LMG 25793 / CGMCC 1.9160 / SL003B-26A1) TaxID=991905 RepID=F2J652_POLGS|nr:DUF2730 family protein [Polymorphum gilvum]ADZ72416.1 Hypothetical phage protein [Polymorphum gilvum SL003B-26A1]